MSHVETWWELEFSVAGADDWYASGGRYDRPETAISAMNRRDDKEWSVMEGHPRWEYRVVEVTLRRETVY